MFDTTPDVNQTLDRRSMLKFVGVLGLSAMVSGCVHGYPQEMQGPLSGFNPEAPPLSLPSQAELNLMSHGDKLVFLSQGGYVETWGTDRLSFILEAANVIFPLTAQEYQRQTGIDVQTDSHLARSPEDFVQSYIQTSSTAEAQNANTYQINSIAITYLGQDIQGNPCVYRLFNLPILEHPEPGAPTEPGFISYYLLSKMFHEFLHPEGRFHNTPQGNELDQLASLAKIVLNRVDTSIQTDQYPNAYSAGLRLFIVDPSDQNRPRPFIRQGFEEAARATAQAYLHQTLKLAKPHETPDTILGAELFSHLLNRIKLSPNDYFNLHLLLARGNDVDHYHPLSGSTPEIFNLYHYFFTLANHVNKLPPPHGQNSREIRDSFLRALEIAREIDQAVLITQSPQALLLHPNLLNSTKNKIDDILDRQST